MCVEWIWTFRAIGMRDFIYMKGAHLCVCVCFGEGGGRWHEVNRDFRMRGLGIGSVV
jgi:hypothetical protein